MMGSRTATPDKNDLRINRQIRVREVYLIGADGIPVGNISTEDALGRARDAGLDLVEVSPNARPPVVKILDYGKLRYRQKKKAAGQKAHQAKVKEVRLKPRTDEHDLMVRIKQTRKFLDQGDKVLVNCFFRGREIAHREFGLRLLDRFKQEFKLEAKIEKDPIFEGKRLNMMLAPLAKDVKDKLKREAESAQNLAAAEAGKVRRVITLEEAKKGETAPAEVAAPETEHVRPESKAATAGKAEKAEKAVSKAAAAAEVKGEPKAAAVPKAEPKAAATKAGAEKPKKK